MSLIAELSRRNVFRVAAAYIVAGWLIVQVVETIFPAFGFGETAVRNVVIGLAVLVIPVLIFAWVFEITPEGLKFEKDVVPGESITPQTARQLNYIIIVVLGLAVGYFAFDKFVLATSREAQIADTARREGRSDALIESYGDKSIAVLPFVNMSDDAEQEYFSDGISEELNNLLAQIPDLRVISRSSSFSYKGKDVLLSNIARELDVAHILEGSVRRAGDRVRITAQLIEARTDTHLWSKTYDRTLDDIFRVQDDIAARVVEQLKITLLGDTPIVEVTDPQAYSLSLQATHVARRFSADGYAQAHALFEQALAIDPNYMRAWVQLATLYIIEVNAGLRPVDLGIGRAREILERVIAEDPNNAGAHSMLGWIAMGYDSDLALSAGHFGRALHLAPRNVSILHNASALLSALGRLDENIAVKEYNIVRDPVNPVAHANLGYAYIMAGRYDEAIASLETALRLSPDYIGVHAHISKALLLTGDMTGALETALEEPSERRRLVALAMAYHAHGRKEESDAALAEAIEKYEHTEAYNIAYALAYRGESDRVFEWLDKALANGDPGLQEVVIEPLFDSMRDDFRWLPFLERIGKSPAQLAAIEFNIRIPDSNRQPPRS